MACQVSGGSGSYNEVWHFKEPFRAAIIKVMRLRERMRPYVDRIYEEASSDGHPLMRMLAYEFPDDAEAAGVEDEYCFGSKYLLKPVTAANASALPVYLPRLAAGEEWRYYFNHSLLATGFRGGKTVQVAFALDEFPLFERISTHHTARAPLRRLKSDDDEGGKIKGHAYGAVAGGATTVVPSLLILGTLSNLYLLQLSRGIQLRDKGQLPLWTAQLFIAVSAFRCAFPNRYRGSVVLRDSWLSSIFLTRALATVSEVSWISQLAFVASDLNSKLAAREQAAWIDGAAVLMVLLVVMSQATVWFAVLLDQPNVMFYEEAYWAGIFVLNTLANGHVYRHQPQTLAWISLCFGAVYLPWQLGLHLPAMRTASAGKTGILSAVPFEFAAGLRRALTLRRPSTAAAAWGGTVGALWMICYWVVMPFWLLFVAQSYSSEASSARATLKNDDEGPIFGTKMVPGLEPSLG